MKALGLRLGIRCIVSKTSRNIHSFILSDRGGGNTRTNACNRLQLAVTQSLGHRIVNHFLLCSTSPTLYLSWSSFNYYTSVISLI